jgi:hypothetical protein
VSSQSTERLEGAVYEVRCVPSPSPHSELATLCRRLIQRCVGGVRASTVVAATGHSGSWSHHRVFRQPAPLAPPDPFPGRGRCRERGNHPSPPSIRLILSHRSLPLDVGCLALRRRVLNAAVVELLRCRCGVCCMRRTSSYCCRATWLACPTRVGFERVYRGWTRTPWWRGWNDWSRTSRRRRCCTAAGDAVPLLRARLVRVDDTVREHRAAEGHHVAPCKKMPNLADLRGEWHPSLCYAPPRALLRAFAGWDMKDTGTCTINGCSRAG